MAGMDDQRTNGGSQQGIRMPRFSLQLLLLSMTLIAVGIAAISHVWIHGVNSLPTLLVCSLGGGTSLGAGIMAPFQNAKLGAAVGFIVMVGFSLLALLNIG
jgi:hypothetical protein